MMLVIYAQRFCFKRKMLIIDKIILIPPADTAVMPVTKLLKAANSPPLSGVASEMPAKTILRITKIYRRPRVIFVETERLFIYLDWHFVISERAF